MMFRRLMVCLAAAACAAVWGWSATAQGPACRYYKVQATSLNISKEARGDSLFIDVLDKGEIVCVTRDEKVGDRDWVYMPVDAGRFRRIEITAGKMLSGNTMQEVISGISPGDKVVSNALVLQNTVEQ